MQNPNHQKKPRIIVGLSLVVFVIGIFVAVFNYLLAPNFSAIEPLYALNIVSDFTIVSIFLILLALYSFVSRK